MPIEQPPAINWLSRHWRELEKYNFEWVAASSDGVVAHSRNLREVIDTVINRELTRQVAFTLVEFEETGR